MTTMLSQSEGTKAAGRTMPKPPKPPIAERPWSAVIAPLCAILIIVIAWEIASHNVNPILVPSPQRVGLDFVKLVSLTSTSSALSISIPELYIGMIIGLISGVLVGIAIGRYRIAESVLGPFINVANATPLNILIPLFMVWVGITSNARILFIVLITFFPVLLNTAGGLRNVRRGYVEVGMMLCLSERQLLRKVILPGSVPYIFAGIRIGVSLAVIGMIVSEMEITNVGIGYLLGFYGQAFQTGTLIALVFLTSLIGATNVMIVRGIQARWFKWTVLGV